MKKWSFPKLRHRVAIKKAVQTPNDDGGFDRSYVTLHTVWMDAKPMNEKNPYSEYIRGVETEEKATHRFKARVAAMDSVIGRGFSLGFSTGFDVIIDMTTLKSDYFLFMQRDTSVQGRLFRIHSIANEEELNNYYIILAEEIEEQGVGYTA
jgi:head-tail adaptor